MLQTWEWEGIQCQSSNKKQTELFWSFEALKLILETQNHWQNVKVGLEQKGILKLSRERLKHISTLLEEQILIYQTLLKPFRWQSVDQNHFLSYLSQRPGSSFLAQNFDNLFRDWSWGDHENKTSLDMVNQSLNGQKLEGDLLVLGAGAGRLAYDLHRLHGLHKTILVDYNPMLSLLSKKIISGDDLSLIEFPIVPSHATDFALKRNLKAPHPLKDGIEWVTLDLKDPHISLPQVKNLLTPWLIDVIDVDFKSLVKKINSLMTMGGTWINFGPLGFNNPQLSDYYSYEEVIHLIERSGFKIQNTEYKRIPYLQSPASNSHRFEKVLCITAQKIEDMEPEIYLQDKNLLPWQKDWDEPLQIPIQQMGLEKGFELNAKICGFLKENLSFNQLTDKLLKELPIPKDQLQLMLEEILKNIHYQSLANPLDHP